MEEKLRMDILTSLSTSFNADQLKIISDVISIKMTSYEITKRCTDLVRYQDGLPSEIKSFLVCKSIKGLSPKSLVHYKRTLEHFSLNITKDVKEIKANDVRLYLLSYEQTHNCKKTTLDDKRRILNSFYGWMLREDLIDKNPMIKIDPIKCDKKVREPLSSLELEQMRVTCESLREKAIFELLYSTGCRVSEIIALNKKDINFDTGMVKVFGKGNKERFCFLNAKSQVALKKYMFSRNDDNEALFVANKVPYNRLGKGTIEHEISTIGKRANINRSVFPHLIRHSTATHMLSNGADLSDVQMLLGHESSQTTLIYAKCDLQNLQSVHKRCVI